MNIPEGYDFEGWASTCNVQCDDGLTIRHGAFSTDNGKTVPIVYMHNHKDIDNVLGHAILEDRNGSIYCYGYLNETPNGKHAKEVVKAGDIETLSIWANNLVKEGSDVLHGVIREVSLVLAGSNPGAFIESVVAHGVPMDEDEDEGIIYSGMQIPQFNSIKHSTKEDDKEEDAKKDVKPSNDDEEDGEGKSVKEVLATLNEDQKLAVAIVVDELTKNNGSSKTEDKKEDEMKHNQFDSESTGEYIAHSIDFNEIMKNAKRGTMREAVDTYREVHSDELMHSSLPANFPTGSTVNYTNMTAGDGAWRGDIPQGRPVAYGFNDPSLLFPDPTNLNNTPEWISRNMDWVGVVMNGVHHTPFSRIKSQFADITMEEARAKGYTKTHEKKEELFAVLKRVTTPTTIYKKQRMDKDDVTDITSFDVIAWIKAEMRVMLNEEIARAILLGDGRPADSDDKIKEDCIRPIINEDPLFNTRIAVSVKNGATDEEKGKVFINSSIKARKYYKGSGNPIFFTTEDWLTNMLLIEDGIGHKLYKSESELATALRVSRIVTVELMENVTIDVTSPAGSGSTSTVTSKKPLIGVSVNLSDYNVGMDKGGAIELFDDFDIDFNQMVYLIETRMSGALTKPYSALTYYLDEKAAG